jgi:hypothetical protein
MLLARIVCAREKNEIVQDPGSRADVIVVSKLLSSFHLLLSVITFIVI